MLMYEHLLCVIIEHENSSGEHRVGAGVGAGRSRYLSKVCVLIHITFRSNIMDPL